MMPCGTATGYSYDGDLRWTDNFANGMIVRIGTSEIELATAVPGLLRGDLQNVLEYLGRVNNFCPFAPWVARERGYCLRAVGLGADLHERMIADFFALSPAPTHCRQRHDPVTIVYIIDGSFEEVSAHAERWKPIFHERGLMLAEAGPNHLDVSGEGRFFCRSTLLVCHRMHREDAIFMRTPERRKAYERYFGESTP